jgi:hypothetical protein
MEAFFDRCYLNLRGIVHGLVHNFNGKTTQMTLAQMLIYRKSVNDIN